MIGKAPAATGFGRRDRGGPTVQRASLPDPEPAFRTRDTPRGDTRGREAQAAEQRPGREPPRDAFADELETPIHPPDARKRAAGQNKGSHGAALVAVGLLVLVFGAIFASAYLPTERLLAWWTGSAEVSGTVTSVAIYSKAQRRRLSWLGPSYRLVIKVAPYSFGFTYDCADLPHCEELAKEVRPAQKVTLQVDKGDFEKYKPTNRSIDPRGRDPVRISQQAMAVRGDRRTVSLYQLMRDGQLVLGGS